MKTTIRVMLLVLVLGGCKNKCDPGSRQECDCPEDCWPGQQVCDLSGNSWGTCQCKPKQFYLPPDAETDESEPAGPAPAAPENIAAMIAQGELDYDPDTGKLSIRVPDVYIGMEMERVSPELARKLGLDEGTGTLVTGAGENTPASKAGLEAGDVILSIGGVETNTDLQMIKAIGDKTVGDEVEFSIIREGEKKIVVVTMEKRPDDY